MTNENPTTKTEINEGLVQLKKLLEDKNKKVHGVYYTNDFFTQRYLSRSHVLTKNVDIEGNELRIGFAMRMEHDALFELENTLVVLVMNNAGDVPGYIVDGDVLDKPYLEERISVGVSLFTADVVLNMKEPEITFENFMIAKQKFTIATIKNTLELTDEPFQQEVRLLFGKADKFNFFSHLYRKELNSNDGYKVLKMIADENMTGKAIQAIHVSHGGVTTTITPTDEMVLAYTLMSSSIFIGTANSDIILSKKFFNAATFNVIPSKQTQSATLRWETDTTEVEIIIEP